MRRYGTTRDGSRMSESDSKHVQTELTTEEYEKFTEYARERGLSVKEAGHEALVGWVERQRRPDPQDRAFTVLDELDDSSEETAATDARREDDLVEEWEGSDVEFRLAAEPPEH
jgi:hypothetical protein